MSPACQEAVLFSYIHFNPLHPIIFYWHANDNQQQSEMNSSEEDLSVLDFLEERKAF